MVSATIPIRFLTIQSLNILSMWAFVTNTRLTSMEMVSWRISSIITCVSWSSSDGAARSSAIGFGTVVSAIVVFLSAKQRASSTFAVVWDRREVLCDWDLLSTTSLWVTLFGSFGSVDTSDKGQLDCLCSIKEDFHVGSGLSFRYSPSSINQLHAIHTIGWRPVWSNDISYACEAQKLVLVYGTWCCLILAYLVRTCAPGAHKPAWPSWMYFINWYFKQAHVTLHIITASQCTAFSNEY